MKHRILAVTAVLGMIFTGCIPALHPVYTDGDLVFEKSLIGVWQPDDGDGTWEFTRGSGKRYKLILTGNGKASEFEAHLARFDGLTYLDLKPTAKGITGNDFYKGYVLPLHTFFRVDKLGADTLQLSFVDYDWLKKQLLDNPQILDHEQMDDRYVVTASPQELQAFLKKHNDTPNAFSQASTLHRRNPTR